MSIPGDRVVNTELETGAILTYLEMCAEEERSSLQRGMNFRMHPEYSVLLMSRRPGAPYEDIVEDGGATLVYEGHDATRSPDGPDPKQVDQPLTTGAGKPSQNALFTDAANAYVSGQRPAERVRVYEKVRTGIWVFNGLFLLTAVWTDDSTGREVFKFRLELQNSDKPAADQANRTGTVSRSPGRVIPSTVKQEVWKRDGGRCVECKATDDLHFDHIIPYSAGGSSTKAENIQILCARHNLEKRDDIR